MKVLLHDGTEIREVDPYRDHAGMVMGVRIDASEHTGRNDAILPYEITTYSGVLYARSDRKADGMVVYYKENMKKEIQ